MFTNIGDHSCVANVSFRSLCVKESEREAPPPCLLPCLGMITVPNLGIFGNVYKIRYVELGSGGGLGVWCTSGRRVIIARHNENWLFMLITVNVHSELCHMKSPCTYFLYLTAPHAVTKSELHNHIPDYLVANYTITEEQQQQCYLQETSTQVLMKMKLKLVKIEAEAEKE